MKTVAYDGSGNKVDGYLVNCALDNDLVTLVGSIQKKLKDQFADKILLTPLESLHVTLFDLLAPLVEYQKPKPKLFAELFSSYDESLKKILSEQRKIRIHFTEICISPAAVFIRGYDNGEFRQLRNNFLKTVSLEEGTKQPPKIIHSTIARFNSSLPATDIEAVLKKEELNYQMTIEEFRLVHEKVNPMLEYEIIKTYLLQYQ